jgi:hypothetical protein
MDTSAANSSKQDVEHAIHLIRTRMPKLYEAIKARAQTQPEVYGMVRRGLRGEVNQFYGIEAGHVVGTPFEGEHWAQVKDTLRATAMQFGFGFMVMWGDGSAA